MNAGYLLAVTPAADGEYYSSLLALPAVVFVLGTIAVVVKLIRYAINGLDDVYAFIGAVGRWIRRRRVRIAQCCAAALVVGGLGAAVWAAQPARRGAYWYVANRESIPASLEEAGRLDTAIAEKEAEWQAEMDKVTALIDAERPDQFNLYKEVVTTDALRRCVDKLLRRGESAVAGMGRVKGTARELDVLLRKAPAGYRKVAAEARRWEEEEPGVKLKENYRWLAEIWEAKAKAAELHRYDVRNSLNSHLEDHLKRWNVFLERFLMMLNQGLAVDELRGAAEFTKTLEEVTKGHEQLRGVLKMWRERMTSEVSGPAASK